MKSPIILSILSLLLLPFAGMTQIITSEPALPLAEEAVTIYYNATRGTAGLEDYTGDVYAHTGVLTRESSGSTDWKYVKTDWCENTPETKLTRVSANLYSLDISPSILEYYGVPDGKVITHLAFVFRNSDGSLEGKDDGGTDILVEVFSEGLEVSIINPDRNLVIEPGSVVAYYLHAMDCSGRVAEHPYIGQPDPHVFEVAFASDALADPDTLWFLTPEAVFDGLSFNIMNFTEGDLDLIYLEEFSHEGLIPFYVDPPPPVMPHLMAYGDTLTITVKIDQIVDNPSGFILTDTLNFTTENGPHHVILKLDEDLLASIASPSMEESLALNAVYPNPFSTSTQISFTMEQASRVSADIYSIDGVKASTLVDAFLPAGSHKINWDGKDAGGNQLADGIYLLIITDGTSNYSKKLILMGGH